MKKEEFSIKRELKVRIENVNFQMLVVTPAWSVTELHLKEKKLHNHMFHELFVCGKGEICVKTLTGNILLKSGEIAIIPPSKPHVLQSFEKDTEGYVIPFLCKRINDESCVNLYKELSPIVGNEVFISKNHPDFFRRAKAIVEEVISGKVKQLLTALHLFESIFELVQCEKDAVMLRGDGANGETASNDITRMLILDTMIAERFTEKYCIANLAKELFISTRQLDRIVIRRYGKSLYKVISDKRFELAKELLSDTKLTVEEVASKSGFSSIASLYREFRNRCNMTPAAFRHKH